LKRQGPLRADELAARLGLTPAAVRQQVGRLDEDGLVTYDEEPVPARGRPAHRYRLTGAAESLFPKRYGDLTTELLGYLGGPDSTVVDALFAQRRDRRIDDARATVTGASLDEQVAALTAVLDQDGYLADCQREADGSWLITEHNCAILTVAQGFAQACSSEIEFIRAALPGAQVERVAHLMDGAHVCAYRVRPGDPPTA
jgi:predicted ArsR family transcriptional regulator